MKNVWRKLRDNWLDFWEDDELDMDKKHLSQHDKRSLLYGGFMIGAATFIFLSIGIMVGNIWTNHRNQKDMEEPTWQRLPMMNTRKLPRLSGMI